MKIAVDVMSGERAPDVLIAGALESLKETEADLILVGDKAIITDALTHYAYDINRVEVVHSKEVITMKESPTVAIKSKPDASVLVCARLVKNGVADGFVSPGNTGATFAAAFMNLGRLKGVSRPAILGTFPTKSNRYTAVLDAGANPECKPINLVQFAVMGSIYASKVWGIKDPKIAILSNGTEESKGTELTRKAYHILKKLPLNFIGYTEGRNIFDNSVDVAICDGFTGNILLKAVEGVGLTVYKILKNEIKKSIIFKGLSLLMMKVFNELKRKVDYAEYGGAPLLGLKGLCVVTHGNSTSKEIKNGIKVGVDFIKNNVNKKIIEELKKFGVSKLNWLHWERHHRV
ncbi:MAG: phosphate acyltransferase PlsX [Spirochaetes bacterium]|nr:phosphate acyltransferase PlsX [Spirochaetota bacterium]